MSVTFGMILIFIVGLLLGVEVGRIVAKDQAAKAFRAFIESMVKQSIGQNKGEKKE